MKSRIVCEAVLRTHAERLVLMCESALSFESMEVHRSYILDRRRAWPRLCSYSHLDSLSIIAGGFAGTSAVLFPFLISDIVEACATHASVEHGTRPLHVI